MNCDDANIHYDKYIKYLQSHRATENPTHYHLETAKTKFKGKFAIKDIDFANMIFKHVMFHKDVHLVEVQHDVGPLVVDLDFRFNSNTRYNNNTILDVVENIVTVVDKYYDVDDDNFKIYVFEKPSNTKIQNSNDTIQYKDGLHLQLPFIPMHHLVRQAIIKDLRDMIKANDTFGLLDLACNVEDIFDLSVARRNAWMVYGSCKPNCSPYKLTRIYNKNLELETNHHSNNELVELLSVSIFANDEPLKSKIEVRHESNKNKIKDRHELLSQCKTATSAATKRSHEKTGNKNEIALAEKLIDALNDSRFDNYQEWCAIGWCLFNIGGMGMLDIYKKYSKKSSKYEDGCCEKIFDKAISDGGYTIASLKWWARQDNLEKYNKIMLEHVNEFLKIAISMTDTDIAKYIYEKYKHIVKRTPQRDWYVFKNGVWKCNPNGHLIRTMVLEDVPIDILNLRQIYDEMAKQKTGDEQDLLLKKSEALSKLIKRIKTRTSKNNIIEEAGDLFTDDDFLNSLDTKLHLLGFNNGVYDLNLGVFREAVPDDLLTKTVGYDYVKMNENHDDYKKLIKYFEQVFVDKEQRDFALKFMSSFLDGNIRDQKYVLWTGANGANGKSTTVTLIRETLGDYYMPVPVTLFTRKQGGASNASPELMALKGIRAGCMQEPDHGDRMHVGRMKEITGGDQIIGRALFKEMEKFKLQIKLFMTCNDLPSIDAMDGGTWRRLVVICFGSEFVEPKDIKYKHQFPKDPELEYTIGKLKIAFINMLFKYYKIYRKDGLQIPESVSKHTNEYKRKNDTYEEFLEANVVQTANPSDVAQIDIVYELFKNWYKSSVPDKACPKKNDLRDYLKKHHYKVYGNEIRNALVKSMQVHSKFD